MKACVIAYSFYELDQRVRRYAEALAARGDSVDVLTLKGERQGDTDVIDGVHVYRIQKRDHNEKGMMDYFLRISKFFLKGSYLLVKNHFKRRYDVIHINSVPDYLVFMGLIPKIFGSKIILDIHDLMPEFFSQKFNKGMESFYIKILLFLEYISVKFADHNIIANDIWREKMILRDHLDPGKCTTLLNYPDMAYYEKVVRQGINGTINIVYPGTISHHHGIDIAIQAIPFIKKNGVKVKLRIYGKNTKNRYNDHLQSLMKELDVADDVEFLEPVHREELYRIYSRSDIGIVPKRDGVFSGEAFSTKIYDFMASGLPVVASRTKIDEYYFDDSMISFFEPGNYEEMAKRVVDVYADQKKAGEMVDKCKRYIDDNTWMKKKSMYTTVVDRLNRVGSREEPSMIRS